jgi:hypothetical protein
VLRTVRRVLRARQLPGERAGLRCAGEPRAARRAPRRQLLGGGAPGAPPRHGNARVGRLRAGADARMLRALPAGQQLHAAAHCISTSSCLKAGVVRDDGSSRSSRVGDAMRWFFIIPFFIFFVFRSKPNVWIIKKKTPNVCVKFNKIS